MIEIESRSEAEAVTIGSYQVPLSYIADSVSLIGWSLYLSKQGATVAEIRGFGRLVREAKGWSGLDTANGLRRTQADSVRGTTKTAPEPPGAMQKHDVCTCG